MNQPGRNDPCYCGSGQKYKKCHQKIDQAKEREERAWKEAGRFLHRELLKFARDERFADSFKEVLSFYWDGYYDVDTAEEMSMDEALRFFDWFAFDYQPKDSPRLVELYHQEHRQDLSTHQQETLDKWLETEPSGAYELTDFEGQTLQLRDFVSGESYEVFEPSGRGSVEIGEVILARLLPIKDTLQFSTSAAYLPAAEITDLADKLKQTKEADEEAYPGATHAEFMRRNNHLLIHHALAEAKVQGRPPVARVNPNREDKALQAAAQKVTRFRRRR